MRAAQKWLIALGVGIIICTLLIRDMKTFWLWAFGDIQGGGWGVTLTFALLLLGGFFIFVGFQSGKKGDT